MERAQAPNHRLLVVSADEEARNQLSVLLRGLGYPLTVARGGREGLARLDDRHHELVIADAELPGDGARKLLERMRGMAHAPPLVLLAGRRDLAGALAGLERGATDYLSRPPHRLFPLW